MSQIWNTINPSTGTLLHTFHGATSDDIEFKMQKAMEVQSEWEQISVSDRSEFLILFSHHLKMHEQHLSQMIVLQMGKPILQAQAEVEKSIQTCLYYAEHGNSYLSSEEIHAQYQQTWVVKRPLGLVLAIMPWNFPLWQVIRCAIPALLAGNAVILKHAPLVQEVAEWLEKAVLQIFKKPLLQQLPLSIEQTEKLITDPRVRAVSFTGSTRAGRQVAAIAGTFLKKTVLELGGSDPYIVLADADLDLAADICVKSRFINAGQSCIAAKRFLIHENIYQPFCDLVVRKVKNLKVGSPQDLQTQIGPLAEERFRQQVLQQLQVSLSQGAQLLTGGNAIEGAGFFMEPTVIESVQPEMPVMSDEVFGPVMPLMKVDSVEKAIQLANQTEYGLGAVIFTRNREKAWRWASENLQAGTVVINGLVSSDPRVPFGGIKNSGYGRELGLYGLHEFLNIKTIGMK